MRARLTGDVKRKARNSNESADKVGVWAKRRCLLLSLLLWLAPATVFGLTLEAETLSPTGSGQTITFGSDVAASGGEWLKIVSTAPGQWIEFTTPSIPAGTYQV